MRKRVLIATVPVLVLLLVLGLVLTGCSGDTTSSSTNAPSTTSTTVASETGTNDLIPSDSSTDSSTTSTVPKVTTTTVAGRTVRYQQNDSHFKYTGSWKTSTTGTPSGGSYAFAGSAGCKVTITFEGVHLALYAKKSPKYGKAAVTLDGKKLGTIDLYSAEVKYQQKVWGSGQLKAGTHTVVIEWTGTKRGAATDTNINVDAVVVTMPLT